MTDLVQALSGAEAWVAVRIVALLLVMAAIVLVTLPLLLGVLLSQRALDSLGAAMGRVSIETRPDTPGGAS